MASTSYRYNKNLSTPNQDEERMDGLNQSMAESLSRKVGQLKSLAIDLEGESKDHIPLLDNLDDDIDMTSGRMTGSSGRIRNLNRNLGFRGCKFTYAVAVAVIVFLLVVYYLLRRTPE